QTWKFFSLSMGKYPFLPLLSSSLPHLSHSHSQVTGVSSLFPTLANTLLSISAIMRGAVLYKLGLDFVKDRIMRRSYGVAMNVAFRSGHHPNSRKVTSLDGVVRCEDVMHWYAYKV